MTVYRQNNPNKNINHQNIKNALMQPVIAERVRRKLMIPFSTLKMENITNGSQKQNRVIARDKEKKVITIKEGEIIHNRSMEDCE
jgi:hypothetical protein